jgi:hypothetical protein
MKTLIETLTRVLSLATEESSVSQPQPAAYALLLMVYRY